MQGFRENVFYEQLFKRHKQAKDYIMQILLFLGCVLISGIVFLVMTYGLPMIGIPSSLSRIVGIFAIFGIVWASYKQFMRFDREFEYSYLDGEFDFDCIYTKSERKRLLTVKVKDFETFGEYTLETEQKLKNMQFKTRVDVLSHAKKTQNKICFATFNHRTLGKTLLLFEPKAEILADIQKYCRLGKGL